MIYYINKFYQVSYETISLLKNEWCISNIIPNRLF